MIFQAALQMPLSRANEVFLRWLLISEAECRLAGPLCRNLNRNCVFQNYWLLLRWLLRIYICIRTQTEIKSIPEKPD